MMREFVIRLSPANHLIEAEGSALALLYPLVYDWIKTELDAAGYTGVTYSIRKYGDKGEFLLPEVFFQADETMLEAFMMLTMDALSRFIESQVATNDRHKSPIASKILKLILERGSGQHNRKIFNVAVEPRSPSIQRITV